MTSKWFKEADVQNLLRQFGEHPDRSGIVETPKRFLKAWSEYTDGYSVDPADVLKVFDDGAEGYDGIVAQTKIPVYSLCEHHLVPFFGWAHIAYIPDGRIVGLSKLARLVDVYARRLQVQERLTRQVATALHDNLKPVGVAVVVHARHLCQEMRGVRKQGMVTETSSMLGAFKTNPETRKEFFDLVRQATVGDSI